MTEEGSLKGLSGKSMIIQGKKIIHTGVNYIFAPLPLFDKAQSLQFQAKLEEQKVEITVANYNVAQINLLRQGTSPLEIKLMNPGQNLGQLLIIVPEPSYSLELLEEEIERILLAFQEVWPLEGKQILSSDITFRILADSIREHAFQEIWESLLGQKPEKLSVLGKQVQGGGLRLVLNNQEPRQNEEPIVEVRIESFLNDPKKVFMETQFIWKKPESIHQSIDTSRIHRVEEFLEEKIDDMDK